VKGGIVFYGRTYWDVQVRVPIAEVAGAKSKMDAPVSIALGGFANNAARAVADRFRPGTIRVVTVTSREELARIRAALPKRVGLVPIATKKANAPHPLTVVLDPAAACRIFRDPFEKQDAGDWNAGRVPASALGASLHVCGRLPLPFVRALERRTRGRFAWVGGAALPLELERQCDVICVNRKEARELLESSIDDARTLAEDLAGRAKAPFAVRVVTGRESGTAAAVNLGGRVQSFLSHNEPTGARKITRFLGVGDVFAANFLATAYFDERGAARETLAVEAALAAAQKASARFITS
jgi:hypothetical protein